MYEEKAGIVILRRKTLINPGDVLEVFVDGKIIGKLPPNECLRFDVPLVPGRWDYEVWLNSPQPSKEDYPVRSKSLWVRLSRDEEVYLACGPENVFIQKPVIIFFVALGLIGIYQHNERTFRMPDWETISGLGWFILVILAGALVMGLSWIRPGRRRGDERKQRPPELNTGFALRFWYLEPVTDPDERRMVATRCRTP